MNVVSWRSSNASNVLLILSAVSPSFDHRERPTVRDPSCTSRPGAWKRCPLCWRGRMLLCQGRFSWMVLGSLDGVGKYILRRTIFHNMVASQFQYSGFIPFAEIKRSSPHCDRFAFQSFLARLPAGPAFVFLSQELSESWVNDCDIFKLESSWRFADGNSMEFLDFIPWVESSRKSSKCVQINCKSQQLAAEHHQKAPSHRLARLKRPLAFSECWRGGGRGPPCSWTLETSLGPTPWGQGQGDFFYFLILHVVRCCEFWDDLSWCTKKHTGRIFTLRLHLFYTKHGRIKENNMIEGMSSKHQDVFLSDVQISILTKASSHVD